MKISELAKQANTHIDTIRYYEKRGLMFKVSRTASGYRIYQPKDVKRLLFIIHAKALGFTLEEIKSLLSFRSSRVNCAQVRQLAQQKSQEIDHKIHQLSKIKEVLDELSVKCKQDSDKSCPILNTLEDWDESNT
ncbi:MAG: heavy metal-responsive transcriptional regulator [Zetaproteobacteria bacterium]|nr:heavy metal-responsive transcriptional regulator [Zetaproteobacteria bacterium]